MVLWPSIKSVKSHTTAFGFWLQTDMNQIFQIRYFTFLLVKRLQKYLRSKLEVAKKISYSARLEPDASGASWTGRFLSTSNFDLWYFCSLLTYKNELYLIWKIKAVIWLLISFMLGQSTFCQGCMKYSEVSNKFTLLFDNYERWSCSFGQFKSDVSTYINTM